MELIAHRGDREVAVHVEHTPRGYLVTVDGEMHEVDVALAGEVHSLVIGGRQHEASVERQSTDRYRVTTRDRDETVVLLDPLADLAQKAHGASASGGHRVVTAYMPGRVVEILVDEGARLNAGRGVLVLEAMKMKNEIQAEHAGTVSRILVEEGQAVEGGDPLFEIE